MNTISTTEFSQILKKNKNTSHIDFINVCSLAEYKEQHIPGVRSLPLDELEKRYAELADKKTIYVHCRSGRRGAQAVEKLQNLGSTAELINVEGGLAAWSDADLPTRSMASRIPIMRQVLIAAGGLVLLSFIGSWFVHPYLEYLALFVGVGLLFAGVTGWCGMAYVLTKMPWNS